MADGVPELRQLRHALPVQTAPRVDVNTTISSSPDDLVSVHIDHVTYETPRPAGHIHVGREFWKRLGLDDILKSLGFSPWLVSLTCRDDTQSAYPSRGGIRHARLDSIHGHGRHSGR